jgi:hypothetical protein
MLHLATNKQKLHDPYRKPLLSPSTSSFLYYSYQKEMADTLYTFPQCTALSPQLQCRSLSPCPAIPSTLLLCATYDCSSQVSRSRTTVPWCCSWRTMEVLCLKRTTFGHHAVNPSRCWAADLFCGECATWRFLPYLPVPILRRAIRVSTFW